MYVSAYGRCWQSTTYGSTQVFSGSLYGSAEGVDLLRYTYRAHGMPVRCVQAFTLLAIILLSEETLIFV